MASVQSCLGCVSFGMEVSGPFPGICGVVEGCPVPSRSWCQPPDPPRASPVNRAGHCRPVPFRNEFLKHWVGLPAWTRLTPPQQSQAKCGLLYVAAG